MFIRKHSEVTKAKMRQAKLGRKHLKETMVKISETLSAKQNKNEHRYRAFLGHIHAIYDSVHSYAIKWKLPISTETEFKNWSVNDPEYEKLFNIWKTNGYKKYDIPVVMRKVKKIGFIIDPNLEWKRKGEYSWWGEDKDLIDQIEKSLDVQQKTRNARDKEWRKKTREAWKAQRKNK